MDFRHIARLNRRDMLRGAAILSAGAAMMRPLPVLAQSDPMAALK